MALARKIINEDLTVCKYCKSTGLIETEKYCPNCRFPQRGSDLEISKFLVSIKKKKKLIEKQQKAVNQARNILFILAGLNLFIGILMGLIINTNIEILIACIIGGMIYFALGMWSKKKPFPAILSGLFIYVMFIAINAFVDPHTIYQGIIWKIFIISAFIYGYKGVKDSEKLLQELSEIKETKEL